MIEWIVRSFVASVMGLSFAAWLQVVSDAPTWASWVLLIIVFGQYYTWDPK